MPGFPKERITVFNNAIDTTTLQRERAAVRDCDVLELRQQMFDYSRNVGICIGGLYPEKRIDFLLEAAALVRDQLADFHLVVIGGGPDTDKVILASVNCPWVHYIGPAFGPVKALYAAASRVMLMPGLVGLAILDSFAYGVPLITTNYPYHSPEIDYLKHCKNGMMVRPWTDVQNYANGVAELLRDDKLNAWLAAGARKSAADYTIENMVTRFAAGIKAALAAEPHRLT